MKIAVHQPNYLPWMGYFYKASQCDVFVILDSALCPDRGYVNRVKVKAPNGEQWLTESIQSKGRYKVPINQLQFIDDRWRPKNVNMLKGYYSSAPHFHDYFPAIKEIIMDKNINFLSQLNSKLIVHLMGIFEINPRIVFSRDYDISGATSTDMLVKIIKYLEGTVYISGAGGANYQDEKKFEDNNIKLMYSDFKHPKYPQQFDGEFIPGLSVIDYLFNCGPDAHPWLDQN